ncbi:MAG: S1C family serine protease [Candidatus Dormibacteraceae bacterium]
MKRAKFNFIGLFGGAMLVLSGCSIGGGQNIPIPPVSNLPPPTTTGTFDAVHAASILQPAVGMVSVNVEQGTATGSGFVIASQGNTSFMVTNNHVVEGGQQVQVLMPDGRHFIASVQGTDPVEDVGVLKIDAALPIAQFVDSSKARVGEPVLAIGSPLGNQGTVTTGVISAIHRSLNNVGGPGQSTENLPDVIQISAPINPGNSGGPLGDGNGRVVGMNSAGNQSANSIGYAIPSLVVNRIAQSLINKQTPPHAYAGICYMNLEDALKQNPNLQGYGILVKSAMGGGPVDKAGIQSGDMIEKVDDVTLNNGQTFAGVLQLYTPGQSLPITFSRGGAIHTTQLTLGERPGNPPVC